MAKVKARRKDSGSTRKTRHQGTAAPARGRALRRTGGGRELKDRLRVGEESGAAGEKRPAEVQEVQREADEIVERESRRSDLEARRAIEEERTTEERPPV